MGDTGRRQSPREPPPCPRRGSDHLGVGVEQLKQGHDQGLHGDAAAAVLVQIVGHGGAFLLVQQVPGLLLQQQARLVPQAAQGHLGAGWPLVESRLKDRKYRSPGIPKGSGVTWQGHARDHSAGAGVPSVALVCAVHPQGGPGPFSDCAGLCVRKGLHALHSHVHVASLSSPNRSELSSHYGFRFIL